MDNILAQLRDARRAVQQLRLSIESHPLTEEGGLVLVGRVDAAFDAIMGAAVESRANGQLRADEADSLVIAIRPGTRNFTLIDGGRP